MKNRYAELYKETETETDNYQHLMQANEETAKKLLPQKKKRKKVEVSEDPRIEVARKKVKDAFTAYQISPTENT